MYPSQYGLAANGDIRLGFFLKKTVQWNHSQQQFCAYSDSHAKKAQNPTMKGICAIMRWFNDKEIKQLKFISA